MDERRWGPSVPRIGSGHDVLMEGHSCLRPSAKSHVRALDQWDLEYATCSDRESSLSALAGLVRWACNDDTCRPTCRRGPGSGPDPLYDAWEG